ncbi:MAG: hypothetical protein M3Y32_02550 [Pseudomonadota bacterium]|nr:hypothetical protein [Pseudomonadota bacterium]
MSGKLWKDRIACPKGIRVLGMAVLMSAGVGPVFAACGWSGGNGHSPQNWHEIPAGMPHQDSIVGLWKVSFISDGSAYPGPIPAGVETDFATVQWHPDGTEFMISGGRAPSTGDVCMGVWEQTGHRTVKLNHLALAWVSQDTPAPVGPVLPAAYLGPGVIHETVKLSPDGNTYTGKFTIDQYTADGITLVEHLGGTVTGTRVVVN